VQRLHLVNDLRLHLVRKLDLPGNRTSNC
jgi:hypothetical protein